MFSFRPGKGENHFPFLVSTEPRRSVRRRSTYIDHDSGSACLTPNALRISRARPSYASAARA
jgi:hypothetical protein